MENLPEHLGGHSNKTNLDTGALDWAIRTFKPKTFLDIGCGPGGMVELAESKGLEAIGIDGDFTLERYNTNNFIIHDYSTGPINHNKTFDLGWSVEFVEHVYEKFIPNYMPSFKCCKTIIMTFAPPGFGGYHHVNENTQDYWISEFRSHNFKFDSMLTNQLRASSTMGTKKRKAFVRNRGLVFHNEAL